MGPARLRKGERDTQDPHRCGIPAVDSGEAAISHIRTAGLKCAAWISMIAELRIAKKIASWKWGAIAA